MAPTCLVPTQAHVYVLVKPEADTQQQAKTSVADAPVVNLLRCYSQRRVLDDDLARRTICACMGGMWRWRDAAVYPLSMSWDHSSKVHDQTCMTRSKRGHRKEGGRSGKVSSPPVEINPRPSSP
jgi:hypothetical protein